MTNGWRNLPWSGWIILLLLSWSTAHGGVLDRVVAVVENEIVTQSEVEELARPTLNRLQTKGEQVDPEKVMRRVLEEVIQRRLRNLKAKEMGITISDTEIDQYIARVEQQNKLPTGGLAQTMADQGIPADQYRSELRDKLIQSRIINKVIRPQVTVTEEEIADLFRVLRSNAGPEEARLGYLLLELPPQASAAATAKVRDLGEELARRLRGGESLATLAGQYSSDPSGLRGGEIGWFKRGQLQPEVEDMVFKLHPGEVAGPLGSPQGFHLFQVLEQRLSSATAPVGDKEEVRVRHILLGVGERAGKAEEAAVKEKITALHSELEGGADFAALAGEHSQDSISAAKGGELGWFARGVMVPEFEDVAFALPAGKLSAPVRTPFGWHIIQVEERRRLDPSSFAAQREELENRVSDAKLKARYQQWMRDLRTQGFVELK